MFLEESLVILFFPLLLVGFVFLLDDLSADLVGLRGKEGPEADEFFTELGDSDNFLAAGSLVGVCIARGGTLISVSAAMFFPAAGARAVVIGIFTHWRRRAMGVVAMKAHEAN